MSKSDGLITWDDLTEELREYLKKFPTSSVIGDQQYVVSSRLEPKGVIFYDKDGNEIGRQTLGEGGQSFSVPKFCDSIQFARFSNTKKEPPRPNLPALEPMDAHERYKAIKRK